MAALFGYGAHPQTFYREMATAYSDDLYDPDIDITPARLYCAYAVAAGKPFFSDIQRGCCLRSSALYLLDMMSATVDAEAYDDAVKWLLSIGWPFSKLSDFSFEQMAREYLAKKGTE
jgi:hypothetical protein